MVPLFSTPHSVLQSIFILTKPSNISRKVSGPLEGGLYLLGRSTGPFVGSGGSAQSQT